VIECARETEALDAVAFGRWPQQCDPGLVAHVAACAVCADLVDVASALVDDREAACREAPLPAASMVWWRATIRARADAARTATQPITVVQGIAGACVVGLTCGLASVAWRSLHWMTLTDRFGELVARFAARRVETTAAAAITPEHAMLVLLALVACLVLAPIALYITLADD
jgi:hypothetical protein